jgi:hypothetical protein
MAGGAQCLVLVGGGLERHDGRGAVGAERAGVGRRPAIRDLDHVGEGRVAHAPARARPGLVLADVGQLGIDRTQARHDALGRLRMTVDHGDGHPGTVPSGELT